MTEINEKVKETIDALNAADAAETKDPKKRREIVKNILIIFLALMLILTFFSNTIMNKSLAEITTESTSSGRLTERVRGSGMVEANQAYEVKIDGNRTVESINIKAGQKITAGDILFVVGSAESTELAEAQTALDSLELEYQKLLLTAPVNYSAENQAIKNAREDLNTAIAKRDAAITAEAGAQAALTQYNDNKTQLSAAMDNQTKLSNAVSAIDADDYSSAPVEYIGDLPALYGNYTKAAETYESAYALYAQALSDGTDITSVKTDADSKEVLMNTAKESYDNKKSEIRAELVSKYNSVSETVTSLTAAVSGYESQISEGGVSVADMELEVTAKQRALEDLIIALDIAKQQNDNADKLADLDVEAKKTEIAKQQKKVDKLKGKCELTEIKSEYSGVVRSVDVKPGDITVPDVPSAVIDIDSAGFTVKVTVDGEAANKVSIGTAAEVVNNWNGDATAVLSDIQNDVTGNSKNRVLVFDVTGDVDSGTYIDLSIPCGSDDYNAIVPKSAVFEDAGGKFVLTVVSKSSPLGNRYYAERVDVTVVASDETASAVIGGINYGDYVITASSKPVSPGDQVRMKD